MNHYPRNIGDYVRDTLGLSMQQDGAYTRLMDQYYASEKPLPLDRGELYGIARCRDIGERKAVEFVLRKFFVETPSGFRQKRCDVELEEMVAKSKSASRSAKARWSERNANASPNAMRTHMRMPCESDARQEPVTKNQEPVKTKARKRAVPSGFQISDEVRQWASEKGHTRLNERLEHFLIAVAKGGLTYADWDAGFKTAIRDDWAGFDKPATKQEARSAVAAAIFGERNAPDDTEPRDITGEATRVD